MGHSLGCCMGDSREIPMGISIEFPMGFPWKCHGNSHRNPSGGSWEIPCLCGIPIGIATGSAIDVFIAALRWDFPIPSRRFPWIGIIKGIRMNFPWEPHGFFHGNSHLVTPVGIPWKFPHEFPWKSLGEVQLHFPLGFQ